MQIFSSSQRYGAITQSLHWATVLLVVVAWLLGIGGDALPGKSAQAAGLFVHITAGLLVIVLTVMRLAWRGVDSPPPAESGDGPFARWVLLAAKLTHMGLYGLLIVVPLIGIGVQFARGNSLPLFGLYQVASPWLADRAFARTLKEVHELLAHLLIVLALLHAAAALLHHWMWGDRTLIRMLPGK
jgi:cytochrome b561